MWRSANARLRLRPAFGHTFRHDRIPQSNDCLLFTVGIACEARDLPGAKALAGVTLSLR
jgi:hypothetical protein